MREISAETVRKAVSELCIKANLELPEDVVCALREAEKNETWPKAKETMGLILKNIDIAKEKNLPICQDTGALCVFAEIGTDVHIEGDFEEAVNLGVADGYGNGYLRKSIAADPVRRGNTGDNTPAFITVKLVKGDKLKLTVVPKGFGSENMSRLAMLKPSDGVEGIVSFVTETVKAAGSNPCPPVVVGVGIGGTFDKAALLSKEALLRPLDEKNPDPFYSSLEDRLLEEINRLGTGPQGFGGHTTCLGVSVETLPTHVAGLPVAVNISCYVMRRCSCEV